MALLNSLTLKVRHTLEMVRFSHSIFALPFALASLFLAAPGWPAPRLIFLVVVCMVLARNTAMAFNRLVDARFDALNPRTQNRHIPAGLLKKSYVFWFMALNAALFIATAALINPLCFLLSPVALLIVCFYSLTKRFTHATQIFLGLALGIAPIAAWIARTGSLALTPVLMGLGVLFWVAGFDVLYALQDEAFDRQMGLKSLVVKWGVKKSLIAARFFHAISLAFFFILPIFPMLPISPIYYLTVFCIALFMIYEHTLIKPHDLSRINAAFFTMNGLVSLFYLGGILIEVARATA